MQLLEGADLDLADTLAADVVLFGKLLQRHRIVAEPALHLLQFGAPFDGGSDGLEAGDPITVAALPTLNGFYNWGIYRWNLVRDTDASGNTVYYVWDDETQLLGNNTATAGTRFLVDIYDTTTASSAPPPSCSGPSTQPCGNCGTQTGTCDNGVWTWSSCQNQGVCSPGESQISDMKLVIRTRAMEDPSPTRALIYKRVARSLGRFVEAIRAVVVGVDESESHRGGAHARCLVRVDHTHGRSIVIERRGRTLGEAVSRALDAAARTLSRGRPRSPREVYR